MARKGTAPDFRHVYFIQAERLGMVKIGSADNARKRLAMLQVGSPDRLTLRGVLHADDAHAFEKRLHKQFAHLRRHGEWFEPDDALNSLMGELSEPTDSTCRIVMAPQPPAPEPDFVFSTRDGESEAAMWRRFRREADEAGIPR